MKWSYDMIPKQIFSVWLSEDGTIPPLVRMCIESQKLDGYKYELITLENCFKDSKYIQECINSPHDKQKWCKASDYLRMYYLQEEGGIYLDADVFVIPGKNFDDLLNNRMFVGRERNGWLGTSVVASEPQHAFVKQWKKTVEENFRGDDQLCFESSMELLTKGYHELGWSMDGIQVLPDDYFFPYNHEDGTMNFTENTKSIHYFMKSWK